MAEPGRAILWEGIFIGGQFLGGHGRAALYQLKLVPVHFRTYLKTCGGKVLFVGFYTPLSHEKLLGQLAHVYFLKLSHVQRFFFNL